MVSNILIEHGVRFGKYNDGIVASVITRHLPVRNFKSAAILLHPFVQMPSGWEETMRKNPWQHIYPSDEETFNIGKTVSWREIMSYSGLKAYKELLCNLVIYER